MSKHNETGTQGEDVAEKYLLNKGYKILQRNWRCGHKEVDIIAQKGEELVFMEAKTRATTDFGFPEETVTKQQKRNLKAAANIFLMNNTMFETVRFDVLSILMYQGHVREIIHYEGAFW